MPKLACECDYVFQLGDIPCKDSYECISDVKIDQLDFPINRLRLRQNSVTLLECPVCGQLWLFKNGMTKSPTQYLPVSKDDALG